MNIPVKFARRYLFSKKSTNAINIISMVAMLGMTVCTAAFILILSVFNGFEGLVVSLYDTFYPDMKIEAEKGKVFSPDSVLITDIRNVDGVYAVSQVLQENGILMFNKRQHIATVKGVDENYIHVTGVDTVMVVGDSFVLKKNNVSYMVLGAGIDQALEVPIDEAMNPITVFMPEREVSSSIFGAAGDFRRKNILASGVFAIQDDFDNQYVFTPLDFVRDLLEYDREVSSLEISLEKGANSSAVRKDLRSLMGEGYRVLTKYEQNAFLYRIMNIEKLAVYLILSFVLLIVAFNMIGSLSMLVIDKKEDIAILKAMGADQDLIRRIFLFEGVLQAVMSVALGFIISTALLVAQQQFGLIPIDSSGTFVVQYYPVEMKVLDYLIVAAIVLFIATIASWFPATRAARQERLITSE